MLVIHRKIAYRTPALLAGLLALLALATASLLAPHLANKPAPVEFPLIGDAPLYAQEVASWRSAQHGRR